MGCVQDREEKRVQQKKGAQKVVKAITLIQRWYRRYMARLLLREKISWHVFQGIENSDYREQADILYFYLYLMFRLPSIIRRDDHVPIEMTPSAEVDSMYFGLIQEFDIDTATINEYEPYVEDYNGPAINFPIKRFDILNIINFYRDNNLLPLHPKYVCSILRLAAMRLKSCRNLNVLRNIPKAVVVGDLRGSFADLLVIFHKSGLPSPDNPYIFNGNYVDNGPYGIEVLVVLLACFLAFPRHVHLHRGCHEDKLMNSRFGFATEIEAKYGSNGPLILYLVDEVYRWLPIGTVLYNKILIIHGGFSATTDLKKILSIQRSNYVSIVRPPTRGSFDRKEWKRFVDLIWSDPSYEAGCVNNRFKGAGLSFGQEITEAFLKKHKLSLIIRSHQCVHEGIEVMHGGRLVTIFSSSNYYALGSNSGAYIIIDDKLKTNIIRFTAYAINIKDICLYDKYMYIENSVLPKIGALFYGKYSELESAFKRFDSMNSGLVTFEQWRFCMESSTKVPLPWQVLVYMLAIKYKGQPSMIAYEKTLSIIDNERTREEYKKRVHVSNLIYFDPENLRIVFQMCDVTNSRYITFSEFSEIYDLMVHFIPSEISKEDVVYWFQVMDFNYNGAIDIKQFLLIFHFCKIYPNAGIDQTSNFRLGPSGQDN